MINFVLFNPKFEVFFCENHRIMYVCFVPKKNQVSEGYVTFRQFIMLLNKITRIALRNSVASCFFFSDYHV